MSLHFLRTPRIRYLAIVTTIALLAAMLTATAVYAALYDISTNDGSVADWGGIGIYQTDPAGDVATARNDAINTWLAAGPTNSTVDTRELYFRLQVAASPALGDNFAAVAQVSCDDPTSFETANDRAVFYIPSCTGAGGAERVGIMPGDQSGVTIGIGPDRGQRVSDQLEWGAAIKDIETGDAGWPVIDCSGTIWIRFLTADASSQCTAPYTGDAIAYDRVDGREHTGVGVPTVVEVQQIDASNETPSLLWPLVAGLMAGFGVFVVAFRLRRRNAEI
jgi:hypothetical protein